jgi:CBS domain-containing protein
MDASADTRTAAIAAAPDSLALGRELEGIRGLIAGQAGPQADALEVGRLASRLYDAFLLRAAELARDGPAGPWAEPGSFALAVLGSQGRREQFLATDQDNLLILADGTDETALAAFAGRLGRVLAEAGMPPCPKGIMAANPVWRHHLSGWLDRIDAAAARPDEEAVLFVSLLADVRPILGERALVEAVTGRLRRRAGESGLLPRGLAREALRFGPPTLFLGHLPSGLFGLGHASLDLKAAAVYPLVLGVKALALEAGIDAPDTLGRLAGLVASGHMEAELSAALQSALAQVQSLRLAAQAAAWNTGQAMENRVVPSQLSAQALAGLNTALKTAGRLRAILEHHFSLHCLT